MTVSMPQGWRLLAFDRLDSTNSEAIRQAQAGAAHRLWITAAEQTAGRGRRGREWQSALGNLACSVVLRPPVAATKIGELSLVAAVALGEALLTLAPRLPLAFKWPNDVQVDGAKLAGILLESAATGPAPDWVVAGIGVNVVSHPDGLPYPATSLAAWGIAVDADKVFAALATAFADWYERWRIDGFAPVRAAWLSRAAKLGQKIAVQRGVEQISGVFDGLDAAGALLLRTDRGIVPISSGEVQ